MMTDLVDENRAVTNAAQNGNGTSISMYGNRPQPQHRKSKTNAPNRGPLDKKCTHCHKDGHLERDCYLKYPEKREEYMKRRGITLNNERGFANMRKESTFSTLKQVSMAAI